MITWWRAFWYWLWASRRWRLIDTAPDNGEPVLVYQPAVVYQNGDQYEAYVTEAYRWTSEHSELPRRYYSETYNAILEPTHWMPRPPAPDNVVIESPSEAPAGRVSFHAGTVDDEQVGQ